MVDVSGRSVEALARAVCEEQDALSCGGGGCAVYLDAAATDVVRWAGGLRWATRELRLAPGAVRALEVADIAPPQMPATQRGALVVAVSCCDDGGGGLERHLRRLVAQQAREVARRAAAPGAAAWRGALGKCVVLRRAADAAPADDADDRALEASLDRLFRDEILGLLRKGGIPTGEALAPGHVVVRRVALHIVPVLSRLPRGFGAGEADSGAAMSDLPPLFTLAASGAARCFPVLAAELPPGARAGGAFRADEVAPARRAELKDLAREVRRALAQLGLDARRRVWALGATSALVGTAVVADLDAEFERAEGAAPPFFARPRDAASLVLLDRTCDLASVLALADCGVVARALLTFRADAPPGAAAPPRCDVALRMPRWTCAAAALPAAATTPLPALEKIEAAWPAAPALSDGAARDLLRRVSAATHDAGLALLADECRAAAVQAGRPAAPPKAGRGRGAELDAQLKALVATAPRDGVFAAWGDDDGGGFHGGGCAALAPLSAAAIEAAQRTSKKSKSTFDDVAGLEGLQLRLLGAGAGHDELAGVLADAVARAPGSARLAMTRDDAARLALRGAALCAAEGRDALGDEARGRLAAANVVDDDAAFDVLEQLGAAAAAGSTARRSLGADAAAPRPLVADLVRGLVDRRPVVGLAHVGGALESFGAALGGAVGLGRLGRLGRGLLQRAAKRAGQPADDGAVVVVFVVGGITVDEVRAVADALRDAAANDDADAPRRPQFVLAGTCISTPDGVARALLQTARRGRSIP
ncbi:hypothetical protein M885DRAFT_626296 [Pelagophyceae sp. CCMP2097]|nr:hypothetical protein M885DRAFT_626296 [Pelagophyceae sp. CCMP2097]